MIHQRSSFSRKWIRCSCPKKAPKHKHVREIMHCETIGIVNFKLHRPNEWCNTKTKEERKILRWIVNPFVSVWWTNTPWAKTAVHVHMQVRLTILFFCCFWRFGTTRLVQYLNETSKTITHGSQHYTLVKQNQNTNNANAQGNNATLDILHTMNGADKKNNTEYNGNLCWSCI